MAENSRPYKEDPKIRAMRIQTWFRAVELASGGMTTHDLERQFSDKKIEKGKRSCIWNKYRAGTVAPRGGCSGSTGGLNLVDRVDAVYPGTAKWLTLPLWRLIDRAPMEMREIRQCYEALPSLLRSLFVIPMSQGPGIFWRRLVSPKEVARILYAKRDLEALIAILVQVKEAETIQSRNGYENGIAAALQVLEAVCAEGFRCPLPRVDLSELLREKLGNLNSTQDR